ncbi:MAG: M55 family metallopeptidase [Lactobacillus sp.]|jgi:D-amino peptidase|nr:M55 family metallopeptidase [Lactobacillus sp.]MCH3905484.1 M55 family metallopeptidase [Lactobacillus sp.]MCH3990954.1 M55 family metallopeptidase [Lactobacillus sp.]MCH4068330.1 M55 family metallopeptidase [Lactobacillus sp.]MCI1304589.1 M55 family metallopeptidase [Lactobacillus sp.]
MKKVYIDVDMEGCADVTAWPETHYGEKGYDLGVKEMTREAVAACEAAQAAGYQVVLKDAHEDGMNLNPADLPQGVQLIRSWDSSPEEMMAGVDETFSGAIHIGYHSPAGSSDTPLDHTTEHDWYSWVKLNGELASEFSFNLLCGAQYGVPSIFLAGDAGMCKRAEQDSPGIVTVATKHGRGSATWNKHPLDVVAEIKAGVAKALANPAPVPPIADSYKVEFNFSSAGRARAASYYPGAKRESDRIVSYTAKTIPELLTAKMFMTEI